MNLFVFPLVLLTSLFVPSESAEIAQYGSGEVFLQEDADTSGEVLPDYAVDSDGDLIVSPDTVDNTVSSGDAGAVVPVDAVTASDVEAIVASALAETYSVNVSLADAYLSSTIVDVFSRVVEGLPVGTHYVAYRLNASDSNEGYLLYSKDASVDGNSLVFGSGSTLVHYYRQPYTSGYQTYYNYKYDVMSISDEYSVPCNGGQLIYTDMVDGYPVLAGISDNHILGYVFGVFIGLVACAVLFRRR